jgi:plastocyanin
VDQQRRRLIVALGAVVVPSAAAAVSEHPTPGAAREPATHTVRIDGMQFSPAELVVPHGDIIMWENLEPFPHTATADGGAFDSGEIAAKGRWAWTARDKGAFAYGCRLHPTMKGQITVR